MTRVGTHRGVAYLTVLSVCMIVTVIGIGSLLVARQQRLATTALGDIEDARVAARIGIEMARYLIVSDPNWRTTHTSGAWTSYSFRNRQCSIAVTDPVDGNLSNCLSDPVLITSTGTSGSATQIIQTTLAAQLTPLSCLGAALSVNGTASIPGIVSTDQLFSCNSSVGAPGTVDSNVEATSTSISHGSGSRTVIATPRVFPGSTVFDYYIAFGTAIDINSIPSKIISQTLSTTVNPYGAVNPLGIYVIDCGGAKLQIQNVTINGTLVLLNTGSGTGLAGTVNWSPAAPNMPCLLVRGTLAFAQNSYPTSINGLVYCSSDMSVTSKCTVNGPVIVGGNLRAPGGLTIGYDATCYNNPPQGFYVLPVPMKIVSGSWSPATN
jgi:hypothetical protein